MNLPGHTRREFPVRLASVLPLFGLAQSALSLDQQADRNGVSKTCESIHQEVIFKAARKRVYEALTQEKQFSQVTDFIMKGASTQISPDVGGSFSMFGGVIVGRHVELV